MHIVASGPNGPIAVVGDSLMVGSAGQTARSLREQGWGPICVDGTVARTIKYGTRSRSTGRQAAGRIKASDPLWADTSVMWVVALGYRRDRLVRGIGELGLVGR